MGILLGKLRLEVTCMKQVRLICSSMFLIVVWKDSDTDKGGKKAAKKDSDTGHDRGFKQKMFPLESNSSLLKKSVTYKIKLVRFKNFNLFGFSVFLVMEIPDMSKINIYRKNVGQLNYKKR